MIPGSFEHRLYLEVAQAAADAASTFAFNENLSVNQEARLHGLLTDTAKMAMRQGAALAKHILTKE